MFRQLDCVAVSPGEACITQSTQYSVGTMGGAPDANACPESRRPSQARIAVLSARHEQQGAVAYALLMYILTPGVGRLP